MKDMKDMFIAFFFFLAFMGCTAIVLPTHNFK